jgi:hypothetical protein
VLIECLERLWLRERNHVQADGVDATAARHSRRQLPEQQDPIMPIQLTAFMGRYLELAGQLRGRRRARTSSTNRRWY